MPLSVDTSVLDTYRENPAKRTRCLYSRMRFNDAHMCQYPGIY